MPAIRTDFPVFVSALSSKTKLHRQRLHHRLHPYPLGDIDFLPEEPDSPPQLGPIALDFPTGIPHIDPPINFENLHPGFGCAASDNCVSSEGYPSSSHLMEASSIPSGGCHTDQPEHNGPDQRVIVSSTQIDSTDLLSDLCIARSERLREIEAVAAQLEIAAQRDRSPSRAMLVEEMDAPSLETTLDGRKVDEDEEMR